MQINTHATTNQVKLGQRYNFNQDLFMQLTVIKSDIGDLLTTNLAAEKFLVDN